jgi:ribosomal protein S27AE
MFSKGCVSDRVLRNVRGQYSSANNPECSECGFFAHHNTRGIIFPYFCGANLSEIETPQQRSKIDGVLARSGPGEARTILLFHIISARPSKQPLMVRTFLKVYMEIGPYFLFL